MAFIRIKHPEGGTQAINVDHITSVNYKKGDGDMRSRISIDVVGEDVGLVVFDEEADRVWALFEKLITE